MYSKIINKILFTMALLLFAALPFVSYTKSRYTREKWIIEGMVIAAFILLLIKEIRIRNKLAIFLCLFNLIIRIILIIISFTY